MWQEAVGGEHAEWQDAIQSLSVTTTQWQDAEWHDAMAGQRIEFEWHADWMGELVVLPFLTTPHVRPAWCHVRSGAQPGAMSDQVPCGASGTCGLTFP